MSPEDTVLPAIRAGAKLAKLAGAEARTARARESTKARRTAGERRKALDDAAEARVWRRIISLTFPVPFLRRQVLSQYDARHAELSSAADALEAREEEERARASDWASVDAAAERVLRNLSRAHRAALELGGEVPSDVAVAATAVAGRARFLLRSRRGPGWPEDAVTVCSEAVAVVRDWAKARIAADERRAAEEVRRAAAVRTAPNSRIYLPVPFQTARAAVRMGALVDEKSGGGSRAFVTMGMDLTPFQNMLPLAFRSEPARFQYPPIPFKAAGQNLWGVFDKETWDHVRHSAYEMSGKRCAICGKRGGWFADKVFDQEERRGGVDCHEVWDWKVEDPATGVGVQTLKRVLVLCTDCHMMFHEGYAKSRARDKGMEDEAVERLRDRRAKINRTDVATVQRHVEAERERLQGMNGVDRWIVDLAGLSQQQYMLDRTPVLREANDAALPPARVAGMAFRTDSGREFAARSAQDIYESLVDAGPEADSKVVMFRR